MSFEFQGNSHFPCTNMCKCDWPYAASRTRVETGTQQRRRHMSRQTKKLTARAIIAEADHKPLAISLEFARLVRPGVLKRLGLPDEAEWPGETTIKRAISRIRAKRGSD